MPRQPKDPSLRARRNATITRAVLKAQANPTIPELPKGRWHQQVQDWWTRAWSSPMVPEWHSSNSHEGSGGSHAKNNGSKNNKNKKGNGSKGNRAKRNRTGRR